MNIYPQCHKICQPAHCQMHSEGGDKLPHPLGTPITTHYALHQTSPLGEQVWYQITVILLQKLLLVGHISFSPFCDRDLVTQALVSKI